MRPVLPPTCSDLPVSSSMWTRSISTRTVRTPSSVGTSTSRCPSVQMGSSYCEVWKFFGMSG
jgi:hypothetical protein